MKVGDNEMFTSYLAIPGQDHYKVHEQVNGEVRTWIVTTSATGEPLITYRGTNYEDNPLVSGRKPFDWSDTTTSAESGQTTVSATSALGKEIMGAIYIHQREAEFQDRIDQAMARGRARGLAELRGEPDPYPPSRGEVLATLASRISGRAVFFAVLLIMILFISGWAATWDLVWGILMIWGILRFILWVSGDNGRY